MLGYIGQVNKVGETYKKWVRDTLVTLPESQVSDMEIVLLVQEDSVKSRAVAGLVRQETNQAMAAAAAFLSCGKLYEDVAFVYESLTEEARNTQPGRLLAEKKDMLDSVADGMPAPDFMLVNLNGEKVSLAQLRGKPMVLDFWATWCGACIANLPAYVELASQYKDNDKIQFITISIDSRGAEKHWRYSLPRHKLMGLVNLICPDKETGFSEAFNVRGVPRYVIIGPDRKIINDDANTSHDGLKEQIENVLSNL